jgi:hypothetical protein
MSTVSGTWRGPNIVKDSSLVLYLDASAKNSYNNLVDAGTWKDMSGNNNNGSLINAPTFSNDNGSSIVFNGVDNYISGTLTTISTWTMSLWYLSRNISSALVYYPFSCAASTGLGFGGTFDVNTQNRWYFFDGTNVLSNSNTAVTINSWYNLVVTKVLTSYNLYTNGNLSISTTGVDLSYTQYNLGRRADSVWYVNGNIAQASIYNKALTAAEITQNYNATRGRFGL